MSQWLPRRSVVRSSAAFALAATVSLWPEAPTVMATAMAAETKPAAAPRPALTVVLARPQATTVPLELEATGSVAAWDEAVIGTENGGLRLTDVLADSGDRVKKGQVLARLDSRSVEADLAQAQASLAEAEAALLEANENAARARQVRPGEALSAQQITQYLTAAKAAAARRQAAAALVATQSLRLARCQIVASDDGTLSSRSATLGAVPQAGEALFRLIRQNRVEWRAEVPAAALGRLAAGSAARLQVPGYDAAVVGKVRRIAPTVSETSRSGVVYVDLPEALAQGIRPGMFGKGNLSLGESQGLTIPQTAVILRDGFPMAFRVLNQAEAAPPEGGKEPSSSVHVALVKLTLGPQVGDSVAVLSGLQATDQVVREGGAFLNDGDLVKVVTP